MYVIQVTLNDNHCAIFQVVTTQILHTSDTEYGIFEPNDDPNRYFTFETEEKASTWFEKWYQLRRNASKTIPYSIPLPGKDKFKIVKHTENMKNNTYTVLKIRKTL